MPNWDQMRFARWLGKLDMGSTNTHLGITLGGGLAVILSAFGLSKELGPWLWVVLILGLVGVVAGLLGLASDYVKRKEAQPATPDLQGKILKVIAPPNRSGQVRTVAFVNMTVKNLGTPSIIGHDWEAFLTLGGNKMRATMVAFYGTTTLSMAGGGPPIKITPEDAIYEKRISEPLVTGAQVSGWLQLALEGVSPDELFRAGNRIDITFSDVLGRTYVSSDTFDGSRSTTAPYFPGSQKLPNSAPPQKGGKRKSG